MDSGISEEDVLKILEDDHDRCKKQCKEIQEQINAAKAFQSEKKIKDITLPHDAKLIDLLIHRILDKEDDWRLKITELINIPHSLKGVEWLRGGDYFEALFQLAIAVGVIPELSGKIKFHDVKKYKDLREFPNYLYEKPIQNSGGGEQGISDITFEIDIGKGSKAASSHKCGQIPQPMPDNGNPFYFISVKGYVKSEKSIKDDYDIPLLSQQMKEFSDIKNRRLIVCVRNKEQFIKRLDRSRIEFLRSSVHKVIGYDEIINAFAVFRTNFFIRNPGEGSVEANVRREFPPGEVIHKPSLTLYFHQELVVKSVINRIQDRKDLTKPHFMCIGVLPRGGKSFIAGGIIDAHRKIKNKEKYNVLFLTSAVNETREQFQDDLIQKFSEFSDFEFQDVVRKRKRRVERPNKFFFVSRQLSSTAADSEYEVSILKTLEEYADFKDIDICFFDEAHVGIKSENVRETFRKLFEAYKIPVIMMTATFSKPAQVLDDDKDLFVWDLQDVKDMKDLPVLGREGFVANSPDLLTRYPGISETILSDRIKLGQTEAQIARPYVDFPVPNFISLTFADKTISRLKELGEGYEYEKAFQIKKDATILNDFARYGEWATLMGQPDNAKNLREFLTPDIEDGDSFLIGQARKFRALNQVFTIAHSTGSRPLPGQPFSMIMFLPIIAGSPIGALCRIWASFMQMSPYWKNNFVFMALSVYSDPGHVASKMSAENAAKQGFCSRENFKEGLKESILQVEYEALKLGKGLVLLSGDVAKMGISLPCVDVVCLMTTGTDADDIIQKMYRALTDNPPTKKNGYIIDLNLKRIVTAMLDYDVEKTRRSPGDKTPNIEVRINKILELCNWGQDAFIQANAGQKDFDDLMSDIRGLVASGIKERFTARSFVREVLEKKQIQIIFDDPSLKGAMMLALKDTAPVKKKSKSKKEKMMETGTAIPGAPESEPPEEGLDEPMSATRPPPIIELSLEDVKKKTMNIVTTFINALVIKSSKSWEAGSLKYADLLAKYREDEKTAVRPIECDCSKSPSCSKSHDNLYETAWCELKSYAMKRKGEDTYEYSPVTHENIMKAVDMAFDKSGGLEVDWNGHIEDLVESLKGPRAGGRRRKLRTWKNGKHSIRRDGVSRRRQTYRNTRRH